jgi:integrase
VRALHEAAADSAERLLVVALCAWGLRPNEVAGLHVRQFRLDPPDNAVPYIEFRERKNGPGEVSLLYGRDELEAHLDALAADDSWCGYVFPSPHASRDHVSRWTVWNRFRRLANRAGLDEIDGESPSPTMGRRFWYDAYSSSLDVVLGSLDEIAAEQGSSSPEVVLQNYLSEARARELRREFMREQLAAAFE